MFTIRRLTQYLRLLFIIIILNKIFNLLFIFVTVPDWPQLFVPQFDRDKQKGTSIYTNY